MLSYKDFTEYFGFSLFDKSFQDFLTKNFSDLTRYDILGSDYISSKKNEVELGFTNNDAVYDDDENVIFEKGNPLFSHFNLWPGSSKLIGYLPFDIRFEQNRTEIIRIAGNPVQTKEGYANFLDKNFLVDNYKRDDIVITFDYDPEKQSLNFIQIRDNNLREHLKL